MPTVPAGREVGEIDSPAVEPGAVMVRVAEPDTDPDDAPAGFEELDESVDWLMAVTTACVATVTVGAVKRPVLEILPSVVLQVTAVRFVPDSVAVNCKLPAD
jgi:hypothetical protein